MIYLPEEEIEEGSPLKGDHNKDLPEDPAEDKEPEKEDFLTEEPAVEDEHLLEIPKNQDVNNKPERRTSLRDRSKLKAPSRFADMDFIDDLFIAEYQEPVSFQEATHGDEADKWYAAMRDEMKSLKQNKVWELVDLPDGRA